VRRKDAPAGLERSMELLSENDSNALNMAAMGFRERTRSRSFAAAETPFGVSEILGSNPLRRHSSFSLEGKFKVPPLRNS